MTVFLSRLHCPSLPRLFYMQRVRAFPLILKRTATQKFAKQRSWRNAARRNRFEISQEFAQAISLGILGRLFRHLFQQRQRLFTQGSQFKEQSRVHHFVSLFLEGENPPFLAPSHRRPLANRFLRRTRPIFVVAHNAAQQAVVGSWNVVMVVEHDGRQCRSINFKLMLIGHPLRQFRVQRVNTLQNQNIVAEPVSVFVRLVPVFPFRS